ARFDVASLLHREVARRMAERLDYVRLQPVRVVDLGCGTGADLPLLARRYPAARIFGSDFSPAMLARARRPASWLRRFLPHGLNREPSLVAADARAIPLAARSVDLVWSNQVLHWLADPLPLFQEVQRVLRAEGLFMFSALGPDTLKELRRACAAADAAPHVHGFIDMHDLGDMLVASGFAEPVMDMETLTLTYDSFGGLLRDLRDTGATNVRADRRRGLTGRGFLRRAEDAYETFRRDGKLPATFEIVYGHAWKGQPRTTADGLPIIDLPPRRRPRA
ncbi:MAG: methyltransferase domain-containing protein, partial [Rhodocyclaceae bacterium]